MYFLFTQNNLTLLIDKLYHRITNLETSLKYKEYELEKLKRYFTDKVKDVDKTIAQETKLLYSKLEDVEKATLDLIHENEDSFFLQIKKLKDRFDEMETDINNNNNENNYHHSPRSTLLQSPMSGRHHGEHFEQVIMIEIIYI